MRQGFAPTTALGSSRTPARAWARACAAAAIAFLIGCGEAAEDAAEEPRRAIRPYVVEPSEEPSRRRLAGTIAPVREAPLAFPVPGTVESVAVEIGDRVERGAALATLDAEPYRLRVEAAQADLGNARATMRERRENFERQEELLAEGWVSEARFERARAQYQTARSAVERAERQLDLAKRDLADTTIEAPFAGRISARMIEPFQEVPAGQPVLEIQDTSRLEVRVLVPETLIPALAVGDPVTVDVPAVDVRGRAGRIRDIGSRAAAANAFPTEIALERSEGLLPGMTAEVAFDLGAADGGDGGGEEPDAEERTFLVPASAILVVDEVDTPSGAVRQVRALFAYRPEEGRVRRVPVDIRDVRTDRVEIVGPVEQGDVIAATGVEFLHDGQEVVLLGDGGEGGGENAAAETGE